MMSRALHGKEKSGSYAGDEGLFYTWCKGDSNLKSSGQHMKFNAYTCCQSCSGKVNRGPEVCVGVGGL